MHNWSSDDEPDENEFRRKLVHVFSSLYDELSHTNSPAILSQLIRSKKAESAVSLWDTHVHLRTDLVVDTEIKRQKLIKISIRYSNGKPILSVIGQNEVQERGDNLNLNFPVCLWNGVEALLLQKPVNGLKLRKRPLIYAPIWADGQRSEIACLDIYSALNVFQQSIVLGPPGSGKSTVLKALAAYHLGSLSKPPGKKLQHRLDLWGDEPLTPIFVDLDDFFRAKYHADLYARPNVNSLLNFVTDKYDPGSDEYRSQLLNDLDGGRALFLLDGLDEIPIPYGVADALQQRRRQIQELMTSIRQFPNCRVIVTSRPAGYSDWTLDGFEIIRLLPLNEDETMELAEKLYGALGRETEFTESQRARLQHQLGRVPRELREQPLFATLLLLLYLGREGDLPRQRAALLHASIMLLLTAWTLPKTGKESLKDLLACTEEQLYGRLKSLAFRVHTEITDAKIPDLLYGEVQIQLGVILEELFELGSHVNPSQALDYLNKQAGILVSPTPRVYRFAHRLIREFLAAAYLSDQDDLARKISSLLLEAPVAWMEPALMLGELLVEQKRYADLWCLVEELLSTAGIIEETSLAQNPFLIWLAGRIIFECRSDPPSALTGRRVVAALKAALSQVLYPESSLSPIMRVQAAETLALLGDPRPGIRVDNGVPDISWCRIPQGSFRMGTNDQDITRLENFSKGDWDLHLEQPSSLTYVSAFYISRYPITTLQYQAFVDAEDGYNLECWWTGAGLDWRSRSGPAPAPGASFESTTPQTNVSWFEAVAFCRWLAFKLDRDVRLPTEAEWEKAARGTDGLIFPWGNEPNPERANVSESNLERAAPVGCFDFRDGPWGPDSPAEMIGNVWEWCSTIMQSSSGHSYQYPYNSGDGRENLEKGDDSLRVTRGGYYRNISTMARCAYRGRDLPSAKYGRQGFRVVFSCPSSTGEPPNVPAKADESSDMEVL